MSKIDVESKSFFIDVLTFGFAYLSIRKALLLTRQMQMYIFGPKDPGLNMTLS